MKQITLLLLLISGIVSSQELTLTEGSFLSLDTEAKLYMNGLELTPSIPFDLAGPNNFVYTTTPLENPQSITKVIDLDSPIESFLGTVSFYYQDSELNNIEESDLELAIKDAKTQWQLLDSNLSPDLKKIEMELQNPISFYGLTLTKKSTLSISSFNESAVQLFPNPTNSILHINYSGELEIEVFNLLGSSLMNTTGNKIDLSRLSTGSYLVKLSDPQTNSSLFKKIIKN